MKIKGNIIDDNTVIEIGRFAILWYNFESCYCGNNCNPEKIKEVCTKIYINDEKQTKFAAALNERRSIIQQAISEYVGTGLHPTNARSSSEEDALLMRDFMEQKKSDLRSGCFLIIYRIRNNLMHGLKDIEDLNAQLGLFKAANEVLESVKEV